MKMEVIDIFNSTGSVKEPTPNHFTVANLKTKAEAATIYMLLDNYLSADHLFWDLWEVPSNEDWYQVMVATFVYKLDSFPARKLQTFGYRNWSNVIRSRKMWYLYPALLITDLFISHPLEVVFSKKYLPTWTYFKQTKYDNDLNKDIFLKLLTN